MEHTAQIANIAARLRWLGLSALAAFVLFPAVARWTGNGVVADGAFIVSVVVAITLALVYLTVGWAFADRRRACAIAAAVTALCSAVDLLTPSLQPGAWALLGASAGAVPVWWQIFRAALSRSRSV